MNSLSVYYCTAFDVPAPFSYEVSFVFSKDEKLEFNLNYTNRDELTDEEIANEGFSDNDDFAWNGNLNAVWYKEIENILAKTEARNSTRDQEIILKRAGEEFAPKNYKEWSMLIQDLIQAVFETAVKEQPWQMKLQVIKNGVKLKQEMKVSFSDKLVDFAFGSNIKMEWGFAKKFMELIYLGEFDETLAKTHEPEKDGYYLSFDNEHWYKTGEAITNPHGNKNYLNKLEFELTSIV